MPPDPTPDPQPARSVGAPSPPPPPPPDPGLLVSVTRLLDRPSSGDDPPATDEAAVHPPIAVSGFPLDFGEYRLLAELGRGGMGVVYRARHVRLDRVVALKRIQSGGLASADEVRRFLAEARAAAALDHNGIVPVYDAGEHEGQPFFTMAYVEGQDLADRVARGGPFAPRDAAELLRRIAEAVAFAHARGVVHRDLKPANILLDAEGRPRITDFGLAKRAADSGARTATGAVVGTPAYMAPEQASGDTARVGPASDVYALGAILYTLLTGRPPYQSASPLDLLRRVVEEDPVSPRALDPAIPVDLETVCLQAMRKDPAARYSGAEALARDLARFLAGEPVAARPAGRIERAWKWVRRRPAVAALALALFVVADLGFGGVIWQWGHAERMLYYHKVALAEREWQAGGTGRADDLLDGCRPRHRGWEWQYLRRLCHPETRLLEVAEMSPTGIETTPDGSAFGVIGVNRKASVYELATGRARFRIPGFVKGWSGFLDGGTRVAAIRLEDGAVVAYDLTSGAETALRFPALEAAEALAASGDGGRLAVVDARGISVLDLASGTVFGPWGGRDVRLRLDRAGKVLAQVSFGVPVALDVETGRALALPAGARGVEVDVSPAGDRVAWLESTNGAEETVAPRVVLHLWDLVASAEVARVELAGGDYRGLRFSHEGTRIGALLGGTRVVVWDAATGAEVCVTASVARIAFAFAFVPGGGELVLGASPVRVLAVEPAPASATVRLAGHEKAVWRVATSPDRRRYATASADGTIRLWDAGDGREVAVLRGHAFPVSAIAFAPDGKSLLSCAGPYGAFPDGLDGRAMTVWMAGASQGELKEVKRWDLETGRELAAYAGGGGTVLALAFAPDGDRVGVGREDGTLERWELSSGRREVLFHDPMHAPVELGFSRDGRGIASVHPPHYVRWSDAGSGAAHWVRSIPGAELQGVGVSPDATRIAVVHKGGAITLLSAESGEEVVTLRPPSGGAPPEQVSVTWVNPGGTIAPHLQRLAWVRYEADGRVLVTASTDQGPAMPWLRGQIRRWDATELPASMERAPDSRAWAWPVIGAGLALLWSLGLAGLAATAWTARVQRRERVGAGKIIATALPGGIASLLACGAAVWTGERTASVALESSADPLELALARALGVLAGVGVVLVGAWIEGWAKRRLLGRTPGKDADARPTAQG